MELSQDVQNPIVGSNPDKQPEVVAGEQPAEAKLEEVNSSS